MGIGISHAIGTGSRDLSRDVAALSMREGIRFLAQDASTQIIVVISKPPDPVVAQTVIDDLETTEKPFAVTVVGRSP